MKELAGQSCVVFAGDAGRILCIAGRLFLCDGRHARAGVGVLPLADPAIVLVPTWFFDRDKTRMTPSRWHHRRRRAFLSAGPGRSTTLRSF